MGDHPNRTGRIWRRTKAQFKWQCQQRNLPCWCGQPINYNAPPQQADAFEADHIKPVITHPHLAYHLANLRPSHSSCNRSRGSKPIEQGQWTPPDW